MQPKIYFVLGIIFAAVALYLSLQVDYGRVHPSRAGMLSASSDAPVAGTGVDAAADGGALGFGIISASCFISSAVTRKSIKAEEKSTADV